MSLQRNNAARAIGGLVVWPTAPGRSKKRMQIALLMMVNT